MPPDLALSFSSGGDAVPGGYNGWFAAYGPNGAKLGYLDYQSSPFYTASDGSPAVLLAMVEVDPSWRRRGIASLLIERLLQDFPGHRLTWGYTTAEGAALQAAWESKHPVSETAITWYHGSNRPGLSRLEPGLPSRDRYDVPRPEAVYLTRTPGYAIERGAHLYRVAQIDQSLLIPDEDAVFDFLQDDSSPLGESVRAAWEAYAGEPWADSAERLEEAPFSSALSQAMIEFTDEIVAHSPQLAASILASSITAAYPGSLPVVEIEAQLAAVTVATLDGEPITDLDGNAFPLHPDGTLSLYHRTSAEAAAAIYTSGRFTSQYAEDEVWFSTRPDGYASGYGDEVVEVRVPPSAISRFDDAFHGGEVHLTLRASAISPAWIRPATPALPALDSPELAAL